VEVASSVEALGGNLKPTLFDIVFPGRSHALARSGVYRLEFTKRLRRPGFLLTTECPPAKLHLRSQRRRRPFT